MSRIRRLALFLLLTVVASGLQGCFSFFGPNAIRSEIARSQDVRLEKEFGIDVGPLTIAFANAVAAPYMPMSLNGLSWVSVGLYRIKPHHDDSINTFSLRHLDLRGWKAFVHVREKGSNIKIMCNERGSSLTGLLAIVQDDEELIIAKMHGNFETIINNALEAGLLDDVEFLGNDFEPPGGGGCDERRGACEDGRASGRDADDRSAWSYPYLWY